MKILLGIRGGHSTDDANLGAHFFYSAEIDVDTDEEAEFAGRDFARLVANAERGMVDAQKIAYQTNREEES